VVFVGLLLGSLLIIFAIQPSIYTTTLWPGWVPTERYPWPALLFLGALTILLCILMYGVLHHWRWLFWLLLLAFAASVIQIPVESLQLLGIFPMLYPVWYSLFRGGVGFVELGFACWMIQIYRHHGVWAMGKNKLNRRAPLYSRNRD
jgi:hypothetical protein